MYSYFRNLFMSLSNEFEELNEAFGISNVDNNGNHLRKTKSFGSNRSRSRSRSRQKSGSGGRTLIMPKKFNFKPPPTSNSGLSRPPLSVATVPSVKEPVKNDDNAWFDDDIDDMLVQATQMVEENESKPDRMEIDAEALNKLITEEKKENNEEDWINSTAFQSQRMIQQTQTVFQNVSLILNIF